MKSFYEFEENGNENKNDNDKSIDKISDNTLRTKNWPNRLKIKSNKNRPIFLVFSWILSIFLCLYFFIWYRWFVVVMITSCIAVRTFNGFDSIELSLHGDMVLRESLSHSYLHTDQNNEIENNNNDNDNQHEINDMTEVNEKGTENIKKNN